MDPTLITACQMFLVPASILFVAIGIATTESLKTLISAMGVALSAIWLYRAILWEGLKTADKNTVLWLASTFLAAAIISMGVHFCRWYKPSRSN